ncbi:hypothetical protein [Deinococcus peraridilitoris]|uniref:Uncharacterized protein n=1 Tax=Deinococcus peraridilitoris (strain DSM 19664 / LMG 22246 / CIP 109416 / KR-200) TaxID=937777 RepID=K9ZWL4_DEIPD|nr:hypothetical protein [Deinococcus peraridilitoris]AFZ66038.1 hypothetical protein Deipe_0441 [Deinococcus peraridilitoris DSM 19664]
MLQLDDLPYPVRLHVRQHGRAFAWWMYNAKQLRRTLTDPDPLVVFEVIGVEVAGVIVPVSMVRGV